MRSESLKKGVRIGLGFTVLTQERVSGVLRNLVRKEKITNATARELLVTIMKDVNKEKGKLQKVFDSHTKAMMKQLSMVSKEEAKQFYAKLGKSSGNWKAVAKKHKAALKSTTSMSKSDARKKIKHHVNKAIKKVTTFLTPKEKKKVVKKVMKQKVAKAPKKKSKKVLKKKYKRTIKRKVKNAAKRPKKVRRVVKRKGRKAKK